jgi:purine-binding chemotaxis protein CheW
MNIASQLNDNFIQLCTFEISGRTYAVDVLSVREVNPDITLTRVPHTAPAVRGLVNVRGQVFLILDIMKGGSELLPSTRIVLFKEKVGPTFGVLVDKVGDIITVRPEQMLDITPDEDDYPEQNSDIPALGVVKLDECLVIVLDAARIITLARQPRKTSKAA